MKRAINILGIEKLLEKLKTWKPDYKKAFAFYRKRTVLRLFSESNSFYFAQVA
jgi:hypothetical protein